MASALHHLEASRESELIDYGLILEKIEQFLAYPPVYPCLLMVHPDVQRLEAVGDRLAERYGWAQFAVTARLSRALLETPRQRRPAAAPKVFGDLLQADAPGPVLCRQISLLFEPGLGLDPLRLLREQCRHTALVVLWPGSYAHNLLSYAVPEHSHYQTWAQPGLCDYCIISLGDV